MRKTEVQHAIIELDGNISAVARRFKVSRGAIYKFINEKYPDLMDCVLEARESIIDEVESQLYKEAKRGNTAAMIFFLKTQGKSRGYVERIEQQNSGEQRLLIEYVNDWRGDDEDQTT